MGYGCAPTLPASCPGGSVTLRATALAAMTGAPVPQAAQVALTQGIAAAAGFGALVLLLSLLLSARTRDMTLARMATMGLGAGRRTPAGGRDAPPGRGRRRRGRRLSWLLAPLVGPSVDLAAFTQAARGVAVTSAPYPLAISAIGLVLAALLVPAAQAVVTYAAAAPGAADRDGRSPGDDRVRQHHRGPPQRRASRTLPHDEALTGAEGTIVCDRLVRIYSGDGIEVQALQGLDLRIAEGELTALIGAAGSGKSTLMNILAGLDTPTAGGVWVADHNLGAMAGKARLTYRRSTVGFDRQQTLRNLLPYLTARQNVADADAAGAGWPQGTAAPRQLPARHPGHRVLRRPDPGPHVRR